MTELSELVPSSDEEMPVVQSGLDFDTFYAQEYRPVVNLGYVLLGSRAAAEDLAQEAFLAAYRRWAVISEYEQPGAWVRRVVANRSVSVIRRRVVEFKGLRRLIGWIDSGPEIPAGSEEVWRAVRTLPKRQAQVVALYYLEDLPLLRVAEVLEVSIETVRTHLKRARRTLSEVLEEDNDEY